ncbi:hypothetical protein WP7W18E02_03860 [Aeromonas media]|nr:hypothetical protein WP7W18E02_03860 [Aeromonas media]
MQLTTPQPPQDDEIEALRIGLSGYNLGHAGAHLRERIASFIKDEQGKVYGGIIADIKWGWLHVNGRKWAFDWPRGDRHTTGHNQIDTTNIKQEALCN